MSAKTKIVVLRMKELIYTGIFAGLAILLIVILWAMFRGNGSGEVSNEQDVDADVVTVSYVPGIYTASLPLSSQHLDVEVIVDENRIHHIRLLSLEESVAAMYPLMEPTMASLSQQILTSQSTENLTFDDSSKYTAYVLLQAVQEALAKAVSNRP